VSILSRLNEQLFRVQIPKEPKKTVKLSIFFAFLGSANTDEIAPWSQFYKPIYKGDGTKKVKSLQGDEGMSNNN